jgi:hypothetical protein
MHREDHILETFKIQTLDCESHVSPMQEKGSNILDSTSARLNALFDYFSKSNGKPTVLGFLDAKTFLLGYIVACILQGVYMIMSRPLNQLIVLQHIPNVCFGAIGISGMFTPNGSKRLLIHSCYSIFAAIFSLFLTSATIIAVVLGRNVCRSVARLAGESLSQFCMEEPVVFRVLSIILMIFEVSIEAYVARVSLKVARYSRSQEASGYKTLDKHIQLEE